MTALWLDQQCNLISFRMLSFHEIILSADIAKMCCQFALDDYVDDFFVDDYLGGAASIDEALLKVTKLTAILLKYGLPLMKWSSCEPSIVFLCQRNYVKLTAVEKSSTKIIKSRRLA